MAESGAVGNGTQSQAISQLALSDMEAFVSTRRAFRELEAMGVSEFQFFNALADLYHEKREPEISALLAEAAYKVFLRE
jgi:hypothetical protein